MKRFKAIAAMSLNRVIGAASKIPWHLPEDFKWFKRLTTGHFVLMGRKTFESLGRPLPNRTNIVVTRDKNFTAPGVLVTSSLEAALEAARGDALRRGTDIMVIGGGDIYAQAMPFADRLEFTQIHMTPEGDSLFPAIDPAVWREAAREAHPAGPDDDAAYDFVSYLKANALDPPR
ncbi:MAG: dihydrofolate reductase [Hyphomicrobiales bacterium]|nr:dihydrofolate reductase [Hyphomicrobiales bacterium]